jgi:anti-sigma factor RsiW
VNHLGEQISALVDGEMAGADLDRANAHLAACARCRAEAADMRQLKRELRALFEVDSDDALTRRLLAMAGPGGPVPSRRLRREQYRRERARSTRPPRRERDTRRRRGRYALWSAVSVVVVGVGAAAFTIGGTGGTATPEPKITPQLEMFNVEHAIISGDVPFPDPTRTTARTTSP